MQQVASTIIVATAVFFGLMLCFELFARGATLNGETLFATAFKTVIFAMVYAAIKVVPIVFKKDDTE